MRDQILDTRDLQKRLDELEDIESNCASKIKELDEHRAKERPDGDDEQDAFDELTEELESEVDDARSEFNDIEDELKQLRELSEEIPEWSHGNTLIHEDHWVEHVEELLKDCGDLPQDLPHYIVINWDETADNIKADYSECEYDGSTYYYRDC